jgi:PBSX family phage terminase large subunit
MSDIPSLKEFDPTLIPVQIKVIEDIRQNFDYSNGAHELLLSGSIGSAKSLLMAHLAVTHCLFQANANFMIGRLALPSLKDTLYQMIKDHMGDDVAYELNDTRGVIRIPGNSKIFCHSWSDKKYKKIRSYPLSAAAIEELTENETIDFYKEIRMRVGRIPSIKENFIICATNPDSPSHWAYKYFIESNSPFRHVYYSVTSDNPFLPDWYIEQLKESLTEREVQRMLYGKWLDISTEVIYYAFSEELSLIEDYKVDERYPIRVTYDFNIGLNKPISCLFYQLINGNFIFFDETVINGANTLESIEDSIGRGLYDYNTNYIIRGDAAGRAKSTKYNKSDYGVIYSALNDYVNKFSSLRFVIDVPNSNPPVRKRHIVINGLLKNSHGKTKVFILKSKCPTLIEGLKMAKLKKGASYVEDDSLRSQHITTAMGYGILRDLDQAEGSRVTIGRQG